MSGLRMGQPDGVNDGVGARHGQVLRRAAANLRTLAGAAIDAGWDEPGHVTSVHEPAAAWDGELLIVGSGKDHYDAEDPSAWTSKRYIADAEDEAFAAFIAAAHPRLMLLVADQWELCADLCDIGEPSGLGAAATNAVLIAFDGALKFLGEEATGTLAAAALGAT